ncbi:hypothetical protein [Azospirillum doebereinerae]|uniref:Uncharacterized protein n=1 Tax=Azospirillum doebereinerae TaxID=92933 RepID=A0A433J5L7_9PROT|nr:hypothetical protein [Azospirillum doebereinerae]MCG5239379.1 hypothetical protein [Azospirillum doebereinerae]RUQ67874.1 hypothetical protein EJ913_19615 [Azospirillum doebereinerae]
MTDLLNDPFVQSSLLPLILGAVAVGVLRLVGGARTGRLLAPAGIALAFLGLFILVVGLPAFPPPSSMGKLFWSAAGGLVLGLAADALGLKGRPVSVAVAVWLVLALGWIAGPALDSLAAAVPLLVLLAVGAWVAFGGSAPDGHSPGSSSAAAPAAVLLALALAVGVTALIGSSASLAQLGLALTAATGGFLLWNWPTERHVWGASGRVALGLPLLLAAILALYTQVQAATLLLALPALAAEPLRRRLPIPDTGFGPALGTVAVTVLAVLPALVAIAAAWALSGGEASPY